MQFERSELLFSEALTTIKNNTHSIKTTTMRYKRNTLTQFWGKLGVLKA
jgi:hypothetical protein